jgi:hypothetical protein
VALFSDIDWVIVLALAAFLLLGNDSGRTVRQLGRWYARAVRLKQEMVGEIARAADLPLGGGANPGSLRAALLGVDAVPSGRVGIPAAVRTPPEAPPGPSPPPPFPWTGGQPVTSWSATYFEGPASGRGLP